MVLGSNLNQKLAGSSAVSFSKFFIKAFIGQITFIVFVLALVCSYLYFDWQKQVTRDFESIKAFTEHNFSRYHQMIDMMQAKIQSEKPDIKSVLNTTKYNKFLGCGKIYVDVSGSYLIYFKGADPTVISEFGMESFALLPGKEFFDSFLALGESKFYLDKEIIFLAKSIGGKYEPANEQFLIAEKIFKNLYKENYENMHGVKLLRDSIDRLATINAKELR